MTDTLAGAPTTQPSAAPDWRGVYFDGPYADQDRDGDEIPVWSVFVGDEHGDPVGSVYGCHSYKTAAELARKMAKDRGLELVDEASPI
jgi:hypothetical protein